MINNNNNQKIMSFIIFILILYLFLKLIQPVIIIILSSILLTYISIPIFIRIKKKISNKSISIILSLLIVILIISIPFSFLAFGVGQQGYYFYNSLSSSVAKGALLGISCNSEESKICLLINQAEKFSVEQLSKYGFDKQLEIYLPILESKIQTIILSLPFILAQIFLTLVITYFTIKDYKKIFKKIRDLIPLKSKIKNKLIGEFKNIADTVIYAQLFVALVQGIIGAIGFYIFGAPFPILSGVLMAFFALVPFIGTSIIWFPTSVYLILSGYLSQNYWILGKGIGLLLYSIFIIATIDNILLAKIVKAKANVNPIIVILGVIGGVNMFGVLGIFFGPILLPLIITYLETFKEENL